MSVADVAARMNKEYKDKNLAILSDVRPEYERLCSNALGLDYPLYGGVTEGRICVFSGLPHSGKTTAACCVLGAYQRKYPEKTCVYVDVEHSLDLQFQSLMNGVDLSKLYYVSPNGLSGEQILDMIVEFQKSEDIGLIVLDSLPALIPEAVLTNDLTKDAGMRGTIAKKLYPFCSIMTDMVSKSGNIFIMINQVRDDGKTFTGVQKWKEPCGQAPSFYSSISVRFGTRKFTQGDNMDACGASNGEGADGFRLMFKILKNKTSACNRGGGFLTYRYATGLDYLNDLIEIALKFDFIKRLTMQTYQLVDLETGEVYTDEDGNELRGKKSDLVEYIKTNIPFQKRYLEMLNKFISSSDKSYGALLDELTSQEIDQQEAAVSEAAPHDIN